MALITPSQQYEFWKRVDKLSQSPCWLWTGKMFVGPRKYGNKPTYGGFHIGNHVYLKAHRIAFTLVKGDIPEGMLICHTCDNPKCVNPDHLFLGTAADNRHDQDAKLRHNKGENVNTCKLAPDQVLAIRQVCDELKGEFGLYSTVAKNFGVSPETVSLIARRIIWKHLDDLEPSPAL